MMGVFYIGKREKFRMSDNGLVLIALENYHGKLGYCTV